ncbi:hypothetical protein NLI96_g2266 [Meripilus lineatus]|uniref:Uncharacterized protein n=1 Tax=Meripilus lineatus TaxID=2056292 RepID=A0AAD5YGP9_9APHY|nr:hypothetical protein NLI96_g2266 [Physisporinus lineatus]
MRVATLFVILFTILSAVIATPIPSNVTDPTIELEARASSRSGKASRSFEFLNPIIILSLLFRLHTDLLLIGDLVQCRPRCLRKEK